MKVYFSNDYVLAKNEFETSTKARWVADALVQLDDARIELVAPRALDEAALVRVHDREYVEAVRTGEPSSLAQSQGFRWDPGLWTMTCASNGGVVEAAFEALRTGVSGSLSSGLHHAKRHRGGGFCTFNGLALAVDAVLEAKAVSSVMVIDFDAHCGGGTYSLVEADARVRHLDVATEAFDTYEVAGDHRYMLVEHGADYVRAIEAMLAEADRAPLPGLCLYNAGMDPFEECPVGGLPGITAEVLAARESWVFAWARARGIPIAFVLAGGYTQDSSQEENRRKLVDLHVSTVRAALG